MEEAALLLVERVRNNIQLGESHIREFKSALEGPPQNKNPLPVKDMLREIGEQLVGFANADGGDLLIGVEKDYCARLTRTSLPVKSYRFRMPSPLNWMASAFCSFRLARGPARSIS